MLTTTTRPITRMATLACLAGSILGGSIPGGHALAEDGTALTIYSTATPGAIPAELYRPTPGGGGYNPYQYQQIPGYAVIKHLRGMSLDAGVGTYEFSDVAALLDPTTVRFESLTDPDGTSVLEQDYRFDLLSMDKMLERYIGQEIIYNGQKVRLLSIAGGGMLLQEPGGPIAYQQNYAGVQFPELAEGLVLEPTLVWKLAADTGGTHETRISYQTTGITWWADYNIVWNEGDSANSGTVDVGAWVSILNQSGGTYRDAQLKLVAGDVHRAQPAQKGRPQYEYMARAAVAEDAAGFEEKAFFEYHLYTLGRPTTIPDRSTKQIELFEPAGGIPAEKVMLYDGAAQVPWWQWDSAITDRNFGVSSNSKVEVYVRFDNAEEHGLGIPMPSGRIRVSKLDDADGSLEFIGEDVIDHTPREEEIMIKLGNAFDVVGERVQTDFRTGKNWMTETIEVTLRNRKDQPVEVVVQERLYRWANWTIQQASHAHEKQDARTIHFPVTLQPDEEKKVTYTVHYTWNG